MSLLDAGGLFGVLVILVAYAGAQLRRLDPTHAPSLLMNLGGSLLILVSLVPPRFNLSAAAMEGTWALVAIFGLVRRLLETRRGRVRA
ncbi:MAG TPA: hypothetical protein VG248_08585 [Caulobacteraceae bacterium]|nr:hypothetical protein [Caulobacteraceae bacterium]